MDESTRSEQDALEEVQSRLDSTSDDELSFRKTEGYVLDRSKNVDTWDGDNAATKI